MTTTGTIVTIGATAFVLGVGASIYIMSKKRNSKENLDFDKFHNMCISKASELCLEDVAAAIVVIDLNNHKVQPSLYRKYEDGRVTKIQLQVSPFPYDLLPEDIKAKFNNGQAVLEKIK